MPYTRNDHWSHYIAVSKLIEGTTEPFVAKAVDACNDSVMLQKSSMMLELLLIGDGFFALVGNGTSRSGRHYF